MKLTTYLEKIGITDIPEPSLENLRKIQQSHMEHIPFENLNILDGVPIVLDIEQLYQKMILQGRGGLCFELNALYHWLLQQLHYKSYLISATVAEGDGEWKQLDTHMSVIAELEGQYYLTDVGFGDSSLHPIPINGETVQAPNGIYRISQAGSFNYFEQWKDNSWTIQHRFTMEPRNLDYFHPRNHFIQFDNGSPFNKTRLITKAVPDGRITLTEHQITCTKHGEKWVSPITPDEFNNHLEKIFFAKK